MSQYEYEKYITTKEKLKETLSEFGVAIIPNVINEQEIENMKKGMWEYLEHITKKFPTPISRNQPESWKELYKLYPIHSMLLQHWGIGHAQFLWDLRQNEKILDIWSHLWNVKKENLLVSFDGASIHMPPETTGRGWFKEKKWLHSDQSFLRNDFECVQSWVTAYDVNEGDATLTFLESSHKYHNDFREKFHSIYPTTNEKENKKLKDDWYLLSVKEVKFYTQKGCVEKCIKCPAGSMVFWDSRTIHAGKEALQSREKPNFRCVGYICCTPRSQATEKNLEKKRKAFNDLRSTTHWPHKVKLFPKNPNTYGSELPTIVNIAKPKLSDMGRRLAGFEVNGELRFA